MALPHRCQRVVVSYRHFHLPAQLAGAFIPNNLINKSRSYIDVLLPLPPLHAFIPIAHRAHLALPPFIDFRRILLTRALALSRYPVLSCGYAYYSSLRHCSVTCRVCVWTNAVAWRRRERKAIISAQFILCGCMRQRETERDYNCWNTSCIEWSLNTALFQCLTHIIRT